MPGFKITRECSKPFSYTIAHRLSVQADGNQEDTQK